MNSLPRRHLFGIGVGIAVALLFARVSGLHQNAEADRAKLVARSAEVEALKVRVNRLEERANVNRAVTDSHATDIERLLRNMFRSANE